MTTCDWVGAHGTALAALPEGDPDHGRALAHARTCPACAARLAEGRRVLALLDADVPEPSAALLRRTSQAVLAAPE